MNRFSKPLVPGAVMLFLALGAWLPSACVAQDKGAKGGGKDVLAVVNGQPITEADVRTSAAEQFKGLQREYEKNSHDLLESSLQTVIQERLVEAEAKSRGVTKDQILAEIKPTPVTDADVDAFYEQNKAQIPRPKE